MLSLCQAYAIAPSFSTSRSLETLAARSGFGMVHNVFEADPEIAAMAPVTFFFVHFHLGDAAMQQVIADVRANPQDSLRYSPIVLIIEDCPVEVQLKYSDFGFDEVVSLPERREVLESRLMAQLNTELVYVQAGGYLGPDLRQMERPGHIDDRPIGASPHVRLTIRRNPRQGTSVLRRQVVGQASKRPPDPMTHFMPRPLGRHLAL